MLKIQLDSPFRHYQILLRIFFQKIWKIFVFLGNYLSLIIIFTLIHSFKWCNSLINSWFFSSSIWFCFSLSIWSLFIISWNCFWKFLSFLYCSLCCKYHPVAVEASHFCCVADIISSLRIPAFQCIYSLYLVHVDTCIQFPSSLTLPFSLYVSICIYVSPIFIPSFLISLLPCRE